MAGQTLVCDRDGVQTRLTCAGCGVPICPRCLVRTDVGLRCTACAAPVARPAGSRRQHALSIALVTAGLVAVAAGLWLAGVFRGGGRPAPASEVAGSWSAASDLRRVRGSTSAVALPDGRVVLVGGGLGSVPLAATEVFDHRSGRWQAFGDLHQARRGHRTVVLEDGRVLVAGGIAGGELLSSAELSDPSAETWQRTAGMSETRLGHTMTTLADGSVLVAGGTGQAGAASEGGQTVRPVATAELYNPARGTWLSLGRMVVPRFEHTATLLADGRVLLAGGIGVDDGRVRPVALAELFDPGTRTFSRVAAMSRARTDHAAVALSDGRVVVVGGDDGQAAVSSVEIYDPQRGDWTTVAELRQPRRGHSATLLEDGSVLVAGGEFFTHGSRTSLATAERLDPARDGWVDAGKMSCPRSEHAAVLLKDGSVLVAAGDAAFPGRPPVAQSCVDRYLAD